MRGLIIKSLFCIGALSCTVVANAFIWTFNDVMDGLQEVPANNSPATGLITGTYDDVSNFLNIQWSFINLVAAQNNAHIHKAARGISGGVVFPLMLGTPGTFQTTLTNPQEADLFAQLYYINIHSNTFGAGEIRGQMTPVPEPATMIALGAGVLALVRRRKA